MSYLVVEEPRARGVDTQFVCITSPTAELLNLVLSEADLGSRRCHAAVKGVARQFRGVNAGFCQQWADDWRRKRSAGGSYHLCHGRFRSRGSRKNIDWSTLTAQAGEWTAEMYVITPMCNEHVLMLESKPANVGCQRAA